MTNLLNLTHTTWESYVTLDPRSGHASPRPSSNITPATLFRVVDAFHPTLLIDEADTFLDNRRELTGMLNTGHSRNTAFVERTETVQGVKYVRRFSTFAAIGIAAIGNLPQTIEDRATHLLDLARMAIRWVIVNFDVLRESDAMMPDGMSRRAEDNTRTLIAIADIAGDRWEKLSREIIGELMGGSSEASPAEVLLGDIRDIFGTGAATKIFSAELVVRTQRMVPSRS